MNLYEHGGDIYGNPGVKLDFSVNVNPLGLPDAVRQALIYHVGEYANYPDPYCRELCAAIGRSEDVPADWVLCGNGAADLIYRLCFTLRPRRALVCAPAFSEYERALTQVGCEVVYHRLRAENQFVLGSDIETSLTPGVDMLFLCHPNNPTGRLIPEDLMKSILERARRNGTVVLADECFIDFTEGASFKQYLKDMPGLVIIKAFTKIYAMAGLRLGYLLTANKGLMDKARGAGQCWSVSVPAQIAGMAALSCTDWIEKTRRFIEAERVFLCRRLSEAGAAAGQAAAQTAGQVIGRSELSPCAVGGLGLEVFPSEANFLLFRSVYPLYEPLLKRGILIRSCANFKGLDENFYRVGLKTRAENELLVQAVKACLYG